MPGAKISFQVGRYHLYGSRHFYADTTHFRIEIVAPTHKVPSVLVRKRQSDHSPQLRPSCQSPNWVGELMIMLPDARCAWVLNPNTIGFRPSSRREWNTCNWNVVRNSGDLGPGCIGSDLRCDDTAVMLLGKRYSSDCPPHPSVPRAEAIPSTGLIATFDQVVNASTRTGFSAWPNSTNCPAAQSVSIALVK